MARILLQWFRVMRKATPGPLCAVLLWTAGSAPAGAQQIANPQLFAQSFEAAHQALRAYGEYENDAELRRVTDIGYRLATASGYQDYPFTFHLMEMPVPNAFALPGGQIFVTRGMLDMGLTDDELATLLGHEIGHVVEQHGIRTQKKARLLNILGQALVIGVLANEVSRSRESRNEPYHDPYSGAGRGANVQGAAAASMVTAELLLRGYSREFEDEADTTGQRLAALAGFDPMGTAQLMNKMSVHIPQDKEYGYWNTHPFFDDRVEHARVRAGLMKISDKELEVAGWRATTQRTLLDWSEEQALEPDALDYLETVALHAWPLGDAADAIRLDKLHVFREIQTQRPALSRDYTHLIAVYQREIEDLRELTPESPLIATLEGEVAEFEERRESLYEQARSVLAGTVYETDFLETFRSNYPDAPEASQAALQLGESYSRLGRHREAVECFLAAWTAAPDSSAGQSARRGMKVLATRLDDLAALERLAGDDDGEIAGPARERLAGLAGSFSRMELGAAYLDQFPAGEHVEAVTARLNHLADDTYGEVVLHQTVGNAAQAVTGIQRILAYAPFSPAANRLRQQMVLNS